jgi:TRAP-type C4-dicarboxylate transport system substrate-binding protein
MAKSWAISGVSEPTREAVTAAASEAGMPLGQWAEQALKKALAEGLEAGVSIEEIEARLRQVVADAFQPMQQALARLETMATAPSPPDGSSSVRLLRERLRQRRGR